MFLSLKSLFCSADLPMSFEDRVSAVEIATQFQEQSNEVYKMMEEGTDSAKTQVIMLLTACTDSKVYDARGCCQIKRK